MRNATKWLTAIAATAALALLGASGAQAQCADTGGGSGPGCSVNASAQITIPQVLYLDVTNTTVTFDQPTAADFTSSGDGTATKPATSGTSVVTHGGNVGHSVEIAATSADFNGPGTTKPSTDLEWSTGSGWNGLTSAAADVVAPTGGPALGNTSVDYRMQIDLTTDEPGTYDLDFTYTIVAQ